MPHLSTGLNKWVGGAMDTASNLHPLYNGYWEGTRLVSVGNWYALEATQGSRVSTYVAETQSYCQANGMVYMGNQLFNSSGGDPAWVASLSAAAAAQARHDLINWYAATFVPGLLLIENEVLHRGPPAYASAMGGAGATGYDWLITEYTWARAVMPKGSGWLLGINEYDVEGNDQPGWNADPGQTTAYINLCNLLISRGLLDFIGCEGDYLPGFTVADVNTGLNRLGALGLPLYITEANFDSANDSIQLSYVQNYFTVCWQNPHVYGFMFWSPTSYASDGNTFPNSNMQFSGGANRPALQWLIGYVPTSNPPLAGGPTPPPPPDGTALTNQFTISLVPQTGMPPNYHARSSELQYDTLEKNVRFIRNPFGPQPLHLARPNHHW
jgi:endo-1,4-beta-xylanase